MTPGFYPDTGNLRVTEFPDSIRSDIRRLNAKSRKVGIRRFLSCRGTVFVRILARAFVVSRWYLRDPFKTGTFANGGALERRLVVSP